MADKYRPLEPGEKLTEGQPLLQERYGRVIFLSWFRLAFAPKTDFLNIQGGSGRFEYIRSVHYTTCQVVLKGDSND